MLAVLARLLGLAPQSSTSVSTPVSTSAAPSLAFDPSPGGVVGLSVSRTSARGSIPAAAGERVCIHAHTCNVWVVFGTDDAVAHQGSGHWLPAGGAVIVRVPNGATHVAAVAGEGKYEAGGLEVSRLIDGSNE